MNTLYIMVGNIGSGKSTFAKKFAKSHLRYNIILNVSRDWFRDMIGFGNYLFDEVTEPVLIQAAKDLVQGLMAAEAPVDILFDETNVKVEYRKPYLDLADQFGYRKVALVMPKLDKETSVERRMKNNHGNTSREVWEYVYDMFDSQYEQLSFEEGFDEIRFV